MTSKSEEVYHLNRSQTPVEDGYKYLCGKKYTRSTYHFEIDPLCLYIPIREYMEDFFIRTGLSSPGDICVKCKKIIDKTTELIKRIEKTS